MRRGEVWWADLAAPAGRRPVLLLSRDRAYVVRNFLTIAPISRTIRGLDSEVVLGVEDGLRERCAVNLDSIQTVDKTRLRNHETTLSERKLAAVNSAIKYALAIP